MPEYNTVTPPRTLPPILIYDKSATDFSSNGLRCLTPTVAEVDMEYNKAPSLRLEHPIDDRGVWRDIKLSSIICVPIRYRDEVKRQPFRIYSITKKRQGKSMSILVEARHIFYDLNFDLVQHVDLGIASVSCEDALDAAFANVYRPTGSTDRIASDNFTYSSAISSVLNVQFDYISLTQAIDKIMQQSTQATIIGAAELYVDGFYFSIEHRMEGAKDNAFDISIGMNLAGVTAKYSNDNRANGMYIDGVSSYISNPIAPANKERLELPYDKVVKANLSIPSFIHSGTQTQRYILEYVDKMRTIEASYDVSLVDIPNLDAYKDIKNLGTMEIGDTGTISDEQLGISTEQKLIGKKFDAVKQLTTSVRFGDVKGSILY